MTQATHNVNLEMIFPPDFERADVENFIRVYVNEAMLGVIVKHAFIFDWKTREGKGVNINNDPTELTDIHGKI